MPILLVRKKSPPLSEVDSSHTEKNSKKVRGKTNKKYFLAKHYYVYNYGKKLEQLEISAKGVDEASTSNNSTSNLLLIYTPETPLNYTANRKEAIEEVITAI